MGTEKITVRFSPEEAINASINELTGYLFSAEQLKDLGYVSKLWKAICENQGFFDEPSVQLIGRYYEKLSEQASRLMR